MADNAYSKLKNSEIAANEKSACKAPDSPIQPCQLHWIEIELVGEDGKAIADETYRLILPDGSERQGKTNTLGLIREDGIPEGICRISFTKLDKEAWEVL